MTWEDIPNLTYQQAGEVFMLRVIYGCTWRRLAEILDERWNGDWGDIQAAGEDLCDAASKKLEISNKNEPPWN